MRKALSIIITVMCICSSCLAFAQGESPPSKKETTSAVVARVNGTAITMQSLIKLMHSVRKQQGESDGTPAEKEAMRKAALDTLIFEELALQEAKAEGVKAERSEMDKQVEDLKVKEGGDEAFKQNLEKEGLTEDALRADIERRIVLQRIYQREVKDVSDKNAVSEDDIRREYEKQKITFSMPEKIEITDIVFFLDPEKGESVKKAEEVLRKIQEDKEKNPWNLALDGTFVVFDTELKNKTPKELYEEARKLQAGELSGVIKASDSLHIIKLKKYSPEKQIALNDARGFLEAKLKAEARRTRMREWEAELKKGAKIEILDETLKQ